MKITILLDELYAQRNRLDVAILALERLAALGKRGRPPGRPLIGQRHVGRPPKRAGRRARRTYSAEAHARMAAAQQARRAREKAALASALGSTLGTMGTA